jgi:hypothetical protein
LYYDILTMVGISLYICAVCFEALIYASSVWRFGFSSVCSIYRFVFLVPRGKEDRNSEVIGAYATRLDRQSETTGFDLYLICAVSIERCSPLLVYIDGFITVEHSQNIDILLYYDPGSFPVRFSLSLRP